MEVRNLSCAQEKLLDQVHMRSTSEAAFSNLARLRRAGLALGTIKENGTDLHMSIYGVDRSCLLIDTS